MNPDRDMRIDLKLFAGLSQRIGQTTMVVELPDGSTVADLRRWMIGQYPDVEKLVAHAMFAIDADYVMDDRPLADGMTTACIPPVSGG